MPCNSKINYGGTNGRKHIISKTHETKSDAFMGKTGAPIKPYFEKFLRENMRDFDKTLYQSEEIVHCRWCDERVKTNPLQTIKRHVESEKHTGKILILKHLMKEDSMIECMMCNATFC